MAKVKRQASSVWKDVRLLYVSSKPEKIGFSFLPPRLCLPHVPPRLHPPRPRYLRRHHTLWFVATIYIIRYREPVATCNWPDFMLDVGVEKYPVEIIGMVNATRGGPIQDEFKRAMT
jgi:hypothetical protein